MGEKCSTIEQAIETSEGGGQHASHDMRYWASVCRLHISPKGPGESQQKSYGFG